MTLVWSPGFTSWDPSLITTALWLDAADASTVTTVSGAVSQWNDKSGNSRNATQATAARRPLVTANGLASKSVITFTQVSNNFMDVSLLSYQSAFILYTNTNNTAYETPLGSVFDQAGDTGVRGGAYHGFENNSQIFDTLYTRSETLNGQNFANGSSIGNGLSTPRPVNPAIFSHIATTAFTSQNELVKIGGDSIFGREITGIIAEIIMLSGAASTDTRQRIEGYLAHKWGLAANLPNDHPYKVNPPAP
jgi:hypothetical protein